MQTVILALDPFKAETWTKHEVENVHAFCKEQFPVWPKTARIYHKYVSQRTDVTPSDDASIEKVAKLEGPLYVVVYPGDPITLIIIAVVAVVAVAAAVFLLAPSPPAVAAGRITESSSPNNSLSARLNSERIAGRIPDIFGRVRCTPDLITVPYKIFDSNNTEIEICYMCIGQGMYDVELIKDGDTLVSEIDGASVEVWRPYTSPNINIESPIVQVGSDITDDLVSAKHISAVNGQTMLAPLSQGYNFNTTGSRARCRANWTNKSLQWQSGGADIDFTTYWAAGNIVSISGFNYNDGAGHIADLDDTYTVSSVTSHEVVLINPHLVNAEWNDVALMSGAVTGNEAFTLSNESGNAIGPFTIDMEDLTMVYCNFVSLGGLYRDDGTTQTKLDVVIRVALEPVDELGASLGPTETFDVTLSGSNTKKDMIGKTLKCTPTFTGRCKVSAFRITQNYKDINPSFTGNVVEEIKWRECYGIAPIVETHFGDLTTVYSKTIGTSGALAVKERKLNMMVTRMLPKIYLGIPGARDQFVVSMLHFDGGHYDLPTGQTTKFLDYADRDRVWTLNGSTDIANADSGSDRVKFGDGSVLGLAATGEGIKTPANSKFNLTNKNFTVEGYWNPQNSGSSMIMCGQMDAAGGANANTAWYIERTTGNVVRATVVQGTTQTQVTGTTVINVSTDAMVHVAFVRTGNVLKLFVNGVQEGGDVAFTGNVNTSTASLGFGCGGNNTGSFWGWMDEFRFSVGIARWTANFTVPTQVYDISFGDFEATQNAADIIIAICLDRHIGNRTLDEVDYFQIFDIVNEVKAYFGTDEAGTFNYTFDANNLSFEEIIAGVADAIFCTAFRRGNVIQLTFEKETDDSTLLFNSRNKIPRSETRTISFGNQDNFDGLWFNYIDDIDGSQVTYYIPSDQSSIKPRKVDSIGVTSFFQAYFKAWRLWNKIRYQNTAIQFDATQEGDICVLQDRVLVADNTRNETQDGEIIGQAGLEISLSVDVSLAGGPFQIFLQHYDGTVEAIGVTAGSAANKLILAQPPALPLALAETNFARPAFVLIANAAVRELACLVTEKTPQDNFTVNLICSNYDARYYEKDKDVILGVIP